MTPEERTELVNEVLEKVFTSLPKMVHLYMAQTEVLSKAVTKFYEDYPDLMAHRYMVGLRINELIAEFPGKPLEEVLVTAAQDVRDIVGAAKKGSGLGKLKDLSTLTPGE